MGQSGSVTKAEPRFDLDLKYGQQGELQIADFLAWVASGNGRVEVKRKRYLDHHLYVETHCDKGRTGVFQPSGINVTTADVWTFILGDTGIHIAIPTVLLKEAVIESSSRPREEKDGSCPTRGVLVDFCVLLYRLKQQRKTGDPQPPERQPPAVAAIDQPATVTPLTSDEFRWQ